ncbi:TPR-like protein [Exidia glandulosa HHB12029]|uniref:TPR-like protein n=1 Tax=Exidia glandulosa HHB12029 TaxID=1314781 RepID=A0A165NF21_EXIGL|nr:TPR-like protein [Exidia glandulosa HHB12029]
MINVQAAQLRAAIQDCTDRRLGETAKWLSELLLSLPADQRHASGSATAPAFHSTPARNRVSDSFQLGGLVPSASDVALMDAAVDEFKDEEDVLLVAQHYFDAREFERCAYKLRECKGPKSRFLATYASYLSAERQALNAWHALEGKRDQPPTPINQQKHALLASTNGTSDPFLLFLRGLLLYRANQRAEATAALITSVTAYPWNWAAWLQLCACFSDRKEWDEAQHLLPDHVMKRIFTIRVAVELQAPIDTDVALVDDLIGVFPDSLYLLSQKALVAYHQRDYELAERVFDKVLALDPYRMENVDVYTNILYVMDKRIKLSKLAHEFMKLDQNSPEVCYLVGNHYSLRAEHEKAVKYFRRAVQLDPSYLSAWTLLGHEYLEMKNSHAAIEAYRRAVDVNRKDFRGWYGLGQAYELLNMHQYSLHYYQRATALGPYEVRIWKAMGVCYQDLNKPREAIMCYRRALLCATPSDLYLHLKIASLYEFLEEKAHAAAYHRAAVELGTREGRPVGEWSKSALYAARFAMSFGAGGVVDEAEMRMAKEGLERIVASSGSEDAPAARDLLQAF